MAEKYDFSKMFSKAEIKPIPKKWQIGMHAQKKEVEEVNEQDKMENWQKIENLSFMIRQLLFSIADQNGNVANDYRLIAEFAKKIEVRATQEAEQEERGEEK